eukprot:6174278-Pleurochrysis_carterae.AAC.2
MTTVLSTDEGVCARADACVQGCAAHKHAHHARARMRGQEGGRDHASRGRGGGSKSYKIVRAHVPTRIRRALCALAYPRAHVVRCAGLQPCR